MSNTANEKSGIQHASIPAETTPEDGELMARVSRGDEQAMAKIFDRYAKTVYAVALRITRDPAQAEDTLQEVFLEIWRNPIVFTQVKGSLGGRLAVLSRTRSIDALRRKTPGELMEMPADDSTAEAMTDTQIRRSAKLFLPDAPPSPESSVDDRLARLESRSAEFLSKAGFQLLSPFADRHGAWECRFVRPRDQTIHLISLACETLAVANVPFQVWAGVTIRSDAPRQHQLTERILAGTVTVRRRAESSSRLEDVLDAAVKATENLQGRLVTQEVVAAPRGWTASPRKPSFA